MKNIILTTFLKKYRHILLYGVIMALLVFLLKWLQWKYFLKDNANDIYIGLIAAIFTGLGIWIATQVVRSGKVVIEKEVPAQINLNEHELQKLDLSSREYEVLQLLTKGHSNGKIAEELFISLSTVKTHVSNLFVKMDVSSRTQAIEKAIRLRLVQPPSKV